MRKSLLIYPLATCMPIAVFADPRFVSSREFLMCIWPCAILAAYWLGRTYQKSKMDEVLPPVKRSIPPIPTEELRARAQEVLEEIEKGHINWPGRIQLTQPLAEELYVKLGYRALHGHASGPTLDDMELMVIRKQVQIQSTAHH